MRLNVDLRCEAASDASSKADTEPYQSKLGIATFAVLEAC